MGQTKSIYLKEPLLTWYEEVNKSSQHTRSALVDFILKTEIGIEYLGLSKKQIEQIKQLPSDLQAMALENMSQGQEIKKQPSSAAEDKKIVEEKELEESLSKVELEEKQETDKDSLEKNFDKFSP